LLGLPPMNLYDAYSPLITSEFSGPGDQPAFTADARNLKNGMIYKVNPSSARGAKESSEMNFSRPDAVDTQVLNSILWHDRKGDVLMPAPVHSVIAAGKDDDD